MSKSSFGTRVTCDLRRQERRTASTLPHYRESQVASHSPYPITIVPTSRRACSQPAISALELPFQLFQLTRPAWGATGGRGLVRPRSPVSIHAPRVGRDWLCPSGEPTPPKVSIHAPRVGRDVGRIQNARRHGCFNSRAPRGARLQLNFAPASTALVSIHAPHVGRDIQISEIFSVFSVSIHAPRMGRDPYSFLNLFVVCVSIHAPRMGRDSSTSETGK